MVRFVKLNINTKIILGYFDPKKPEIKFDNPIQRGYVWKRDRKSLLIHSMILGRPINPIYANKVKDVYDVIDGQQRVKTIYDFYMNKFALSPVPDIVMPDGEIVSISGKKFRELRDDLKRLFLNYNIDLQHTEDLDQDQIKDNFLCLNNGKPLTATEITKAQIKSVKEISELSEHPVFDYVMNQEGKAASKNIGLTMQLYVILCTDEKDSKCLLNSRIKQLLSNQEITNEQKTKINNCLDSMLEVFNILSTEKSEIAKRARLILKRKIHFLSVFAVIDYVISNNISIELLIEWIKHFFDAPIGSTSISEIYNQHLKDSTNSVVSVEARLKSMLDDFCEMCLGSEVICTMKN